MTNSQAIIAEARALASDSTFSLNERIEALENLRDEFLVLIDELRNEMEQ